MQQKRQWSLTVCASSKPLNVYSILPLLLQWLERKEDRYTSHDIQNEIIAIMANHVIRDLVSEIRGGFFSIIFDEYTDISNKEQLTICIRWVDKELEAHKISSGFTMYLTSARRL